jgi:multidrug resistance efflux pump
MRNVLRRIWIPILVIALGGIVWSVARPKPDPGLEINIARATTGEFVREVRANGSVDVRVYTLTFPRPGRVARVLVKEGQSVAAGAVLAELDTTDDTVKLSSARANLAATVTQLGAQGNETDASRAKVQSQLDAARAKLASTRSLAAVGGASRNELEDASRAVRDLESQVRIQSSQSTTSQSTLIATKSAREAEIKALERSISQAQLRSPVDGTVSKVDFLAGVEAGQSTLRVVENRTLEFRAKLAEADIPGLALGQPARIILDAAPSTPLQAKVARLAVQAEVSGQGGSAILPVILRFTDANARSLARPGLTASARITTLRIKDAVMIPLETLLEEQGKSSVWVVDETAKTIQKRPVTIRARNLTQAAVKGVPVGAILVSLPPETLKDGQKVRYTLEKRK